MVCIIIKLINFVQYTICNLLFISASLSDKDKEALLGICIFLPLCILSWWIFNRCVVPSLQRRGEESRQKEEEDRKALESEQKSAELDEEDLEKYRREEPEVTSQEYYADLIATQDDSLNLVTFAVLLSFSVFIVILSYFAFKNLRNWWRYKLYNWKLKKKHKGK